MTGINAIPRTYNGGGLAYISPQEAIWLRQMGGGVPTDPQTGQRNESQQLLGPGNIPSYDSPGFGSSISAMSGESMSPSKGSQGTYGFFAASNPQADAMAEFNRRINVPRGGPGYSGQGYRPGPVAGPAVVEEEEEPNVPT